MTVPDQRLQLTSVAVPNPRPTPELPKRAAEAPLSSQVSKLTLAPYWLVPERPDCEHSGLPEAGHKLSTMTTMLLPALETLFPEESVWIVSLMEQVAKSALID